MMMTATCATFVATILAAQPGGVVELPKQPEACGYVRLNAVKKAAPGVTVKIHPDQKIGLDLRLSEGLHFQGGWFVGGGNGIANAGRNGAYVISSHRFSFDGSRFGNHAEGTLQGAVIQRSTNWRVTGSTFSYHWDGLIVAEASQFQVIGNIFRDDGIPGSTCIFPDGQEEEWRKGKAACQQAGGVWKDGPHPDAVQIFNNVWDGLFERNRVEGYQQGIGVMGSEGTLGIRRLWLIDNEYRGDFPHAFRWIADDMFARGNRLGWPEDRDATFGWKVVLRLDPARGGVGCENVLIAPGGAFDPSGAPFGQPCQNVAPPPAPAEPVGLPAL
jgi:hypothetical protein